MSEATLTTWVQLGAPGMLALVLFFTGKAGLKLLDRFANSLDKLDTTIAGLHLHVQTTALTEAGNVERRHAEITSLVTQNRMAIVAALESVAKEIRHDQRSAITAAQLDLALLIKEHKE